MTVDYIRGISAVSSPTTACAASSPTEPPFSIRFSIFLDGTGNNLWNTDTLRRPGGHSVGDHDSRGSYLNAYSNVAHLATSIETLCAVNDYHVPVYVEGMGTLHDQPDATLGMGAGTGSTGVAGRVSACIEHMLSKVDELSNGNRQIDTLQIDIFGFSRGAAAARYLLHRCFHAADTGLSYSFLAALSNRGYTVGTKRFPFIGLFDTVASYGATTYEDDVDELHLQSLGHPLVQYVLQLAAADEHRRNFQLVDITSARSRGRQIFLPGAHSDVGGGYNGLSDGDMVERDLVVFEMNNLDELSVSSLNQALTRCDEVQRDLIARGWYVNRTNHEEIVVDRHRVVVNRRRISHYYHRVPLLIMAHQATERGGLQFSLEEQALERIGSDGGDEFLIQMKARIENNHRSIDDWLNDTSDEQLKQLRNRYLHFSAHYTPGSAEYPRTASAAARPNRPQFYSPGSGWEEGDDNSLHGVRKRMVREG